jgi:hypothetical protein
MNELKQAVRLFLAWDSIWKEKEELNLDYFQTQMAENKKNTANNTVEARIPETYQWVLVPTQPNAKGVVEWLKYRQQGHDALAVRVSKKLKTEELLISEYSGTRLRLELDRIPLWRGNHVRIKQLLEDFTTFLYLPRLKNENVLLDAIRSGVSSLQWESETFAYAEGFDETTGKYRGLVAGKNARIVVDSESLLVKPEVALKQIEAETEHSTGGKEVVSGGEGTKPEIPVGGPHEKEEKTVKRFYGTVKLKPLGVGSQAGKISEEIIQHIEALPQADVEILLEIQANVPEGVPENVVRIVSENCRTLQFEKFEFEEE